MYYVFLFINIPKTIDRFSRIVISKIDILTMVFFLIDYLIKTQKKRIRNT